MRKKMPSRNNYKITSLAPTNTLSSIDREMLLREKREELDKLQNRMRKSMQLLIQGKEPTQMYNTVFPGYGQPIPKSVTRRYWYGGGNYAESPSEEPTKTTTTSPIRSPHPAPNVLEEPTKTTTISPVKDKWSEVQTIESIDGIPGVLQTSRNKIPEQPMWRYISDKTPVDRIEVPEAKPAVPKTKRSKMSRSDTVISMSDTVVSVKDNMEADREITPTASVEESGITPKETPTQFRTVSATSGMEQPEVSDQFRVPRIVEVAEVIAEKQVENEKEEQEEEEEIMGSFDGLEDVGFVRIRGLHLDGLEIIDMRDNEDQAEQQSDIALARPNTVMSPRGQEQHIRNEERMGYELDSNVDERRRVREFEERMANLQGALAGNQILDELDRHAGVQRLLPALRPPISSEFEFEYSQKPRQQIRHTPLLETDSDDMELSQHSFSMENSVSSDTEEVESSSSEMDTQMFEMDRRYGNGRQATIII